MAYGMCLKRLGVAMVAVGLTSAGAGCTTAPQTFYVRSSAWEARGPNSDEPVQAWDSQCLAGELRPGRRVQGVLADGEWVAVVAADRSAAHEVSGGLLAVFGLASTLLGTAMLVDMRNIENNENAGLAAAYHLMFGIPLVTIGLPTFVGGSIGAHRAPSFGPSFEVTEDQGGDPPRACRDVLAR